MKRFVITLSACFLFLAAFSQTKHTVTPKFTTLDKSPMDMAYFPVDYPLLKAQGKATDPLIARIIYSRPQKDNRVVFGELVEYGQVWRLGANEATELEFFKDVVIDGKKVAKGRYTLYCIPSAAQWTLVLNKDTDTWGAFIYDPKKDLLRVSVPVQNSPSSVEAFSMNFLKTPAGAELAIAWDKVLVSLPIGLK